MTTYPFYYLSTSTNKSNLYLDVFIYSFRYELITPKYKNGDNDRLAAGTRLDAVNLR